MHMLNSKLTVDVPRTHMHHVMRIDSSFSIMLARDPSKLFAPDSHANIVVLSSTMEGIWKRATQGLVHSLRYWEG